ncbi:MULTISPECIES: efflux RND transporter periplasmic adaptor subunit [Methylosinus]|uniref:Secretion protein HlyD n=1 Tax=Methylosinus trichosporium (strain ATCC 35070 / NCIMB 11131 / UNIQEM 75 / OB3b) TaxID=595536 RepID=A0A2D2D7R7_METT3|nr:MULTISPECIES: efflux RND transporter periplasmic adaptor subunit [Methylosinus]ATQ70975.1 secretion protein HlyD [Methylosinus trichosporium OB3b]OBS53335.1 secretion protein HlyD [Methylosinus sp. 3S-1]
MKRKAILAASLVAALLGFWLWRRAPADDGPLLLAGNVEVRQIDLAFKVGGRIKRLLVDEGDHIAEGQTIAVLDKIYFEEALSQAQAQRDQAAANLAKLEAGNRPEEIAQVEATVAEREAMLLNAQQTLERSDQLMKKGAGSRQTSEDATAAQREAEARLRSARHALRLMQIGFRKEEIDVARAQLAESEAVAQISARQLADAELAAPSAGVILSRVREVGAIVDAGETVFVSSLTTPVWVRSYVSEPDLPRVRPGMPVAVTADGGAGPFEGRLGFISTTAEFTPKSVETRELRTALVYRLRVLVDDPGGVLRQGMPVTITAQRPPDGAREAAR